MFGRSSFAGKEAGKCLALCDEADNLAVDAFSLTVQQESSPTNVRVLDPSMVLR